MTALSRAMQNRRQFLLNGSLFASAMLGASSTSAVGKLTSPAPSDALLPPVSPPTFAGLRGPSGVAPTLFAAALGALERGRGRFVRDRIAVVDFSAPSSVPRFHLIDLGDGKVASFLVAHGKGSDPDHSGWLERFSNQPGSNASSSGAFVTGDYYIGSHGRSQRLIGLDPTNDNALERAIVVHGAWYSEAGMIAGHGKLGRSQGCFAVGESRIEEVFGRLGPGRLIYAAKVAG